jgi:hypothetical protein
MPETLLAEDRQRCGDTVQNTFDVGVWGATEQKTGLTANRDELPIRIIQMEAPRQLLGR